MKKIRIPRKKKKLGYITKMHSCNYNHFPNVPKLQKYLYYIDVERNLNRCGISAEGLGNKFGCITMDYVIWWSWVRYKELNIKPNLSGAHKEYWDYFVSKGVIKIK